MVSDNQNESWTNKYVDRDPKKGRIKWHFLGITFNKPVQISDAWHFFKFLMIVFAAIAIILHVPMLFTNNIYIDFFIELIIFGLAWNLPFNLFYNKILVTKK